MYSKAISCCRLEEDKIYRKILSKRFYWILTDSVALIGECRAVILGRAGLGLLGFGLCFYSIAQTTVTLPLCTFSPHAKTSPEQLSVFPYDILRKMIKYLLLHAFHSEIPAQFCRMILDYAIFMPSLSFMADLRSKP